MWPCTEVDCGSQPPWWKDPLLRVGALSEATRLVRIKNVLTGQEDTMEVPSEETMGEVQRRYLPVNAHAASYTWKALVSEVACGRAAQGMFSCQCRSLQLAGWPLTQPGPTKPDQPSKPSRSQARRDPKAAAPPEWIELDMNKSLEANGVPDERAAYEAVGLPGEEAVPVLHVYWNDDLTVA